MAKKSSSRKSLKSLFSRSEAKLDESVEKDADKNGGEKKRFKFLKLKIKSKGGSASEKSTTESQQISSSPEPNRTAEDGDAWAENTVSDKKRSSLYATAPRSKGKGFSYSELDLRKPKRFATFSLGFRKKKRRDDENTSKSTFGLHSMGIDEQEENPLDLSQVQLNQANTMTMFSMSQPELDTSNTFDVPSPPPVATNQLESNFPLLNQSQSSGTVDTEPESQEPLTNSFELLEQEIQKAPIATITELQLDDPDSSEEEENIPIHNSTKSNSNSSAPMTHTKIISAVNAQTAPSVPANQHAVMLDTSDHKTAVVDSVCVNKSLHDRDVPRKSNTITEMSLTESTSVTLSHHQPGASDTADSPTPSSEASLAYVDSTITESAPAFHTDNSALIGDSATIHHEVSVSQNEISIPVCANENLPDSDVPQQSNTKTEISLTESTSVNHQPEASNTADSPTPSSEASLAYVDSTITESAPAFHTDNSALIGDSTTIHNHEVSVSQSERSIPETTRTITTTSAVSSEKHASPVNQDAVYGALYDSLFPKTFASEILSSLSIPSSQINTEVTRHGNVEHFMIKTLNECHTETNVTYSCLSTSHDSSTRKMDDAVGSYTNTNFSETKGISSSEGSSTVVVSTSDALNALYEPLDNQRFTSFQSSAASEPQKYPDVLCGYLPCTVNSHSELAGQDTDKIPYSELTQFHAGVKSDNYSLVEDTVRSVSENFAPPISHSATSQRTDTQVTDSKQSVILDKELVADGTNADTGSPSPVPDKMTAVKGLDVKIEKTEKENFSAPSELLEDYEVAPNPAYLSVGSDDGSTMEVYYSAEEDNTEESGDGELYTMDEREETCVFDGLKEVQELQQQEEGDKMGSEEKQEHLDSLSETQQLLREDQLQETEFLEGSDERSQETEKTDRLFPLIKRAGEEERKEELLDTPVQQVNTLMVCEFAPPSSKLDGQGEGSEGNWTVDLETQDHSNEEKELPNVQVHAASGYREENMFTPKCRDAEEQASLTEEAGKKEKGSKEGTDTTKIAIIDASVVAEVVTGTLAPCIVPKSDATEIEHNRAVPSSEWVDPITQATDRHGTVLDQMSVLNIDTHHPGTKSAEALSGGQEFPPEFQADLNQGSLTAASESQQTEVDQETADKMNSGFSRLSTSLLIKKSSPTKENDSTTRFRKLSLVTDTDNTEVNQDVVDYSRTSTTVTESNEPDLGSEYTFRNNFDRVSQYKPYKSDNSSFSHQSYQLYDTNSSTSSFTSSSVPVPVAIAYKYHSNVSSSSSSHSTEEPITLDNRLSDVYLSRESEPAGEPEDDCGRSFVEQEESAAPAGEREGQREGEAESERIKSRWESQQLPVSSFSSVHQTSRDTTDSTREEDGSSSHFTGVFKAMRVELVSDQAALPPASPDMDSPRQCEMDSLVDTLKSMGPSQRPRSIGLRGPPQGLQSALPPIVEDVPIPTKSNIHTSPTSLKNEMAAIGIHNKSLNGLYTLPVDLGLKRSTTRDTRSPLELMKQSQQDQQQPGTRGLTLPLRTPANNNVMMRKFSDSSPEDPKSPLLNGNGVLMSPNSGSRLDNSSIFANYRSPTKEQTLDNGMVHRSIFGTNSLPETVTNNNRMSGWKEIGEHGNVTDSAGSRFERFSFLLNSSSSSSGSMNGVEDPNARMSRPPSLGIGSPPSSSIINSAIDYHRPFTTTDSPMSMFGQTQGMGMGMGVGTSTLTSPILQRSFSNEGTVGIQQTSLFNSLQGGSQHQSKEPEPDKNLLSKYRAFPDAYLTKEKEHGKLNPRPGKIYIFDRPGMCGKRTEVRSDVVDATSWELQDTISIRVIRGGWVLYEKPNFKGEKVALDEGDIELTCPFHSPEEQQQNGQNSEQNGQTSDEQTKPSRKFIIGSLRRAVRDYSVPDISLFPEENAEGKKVIFRDTSEDARIFGFPIKANSIIINAGLWLVFAQPFFQGVPRVLEVGGYTNPAAWGVEQPYVGSLHPLKIAEPRVENISEPKLVIYDKPYFTGKSRTITTNMKDFMTRTDRQQTAFMYNVGSLKVLGGIWVGYEKEGFRGHQYLLEEGEYHDWRVWGGCDAELRSIRLIRADLTEPLMVMFEQLEEEDEGAQEENTFEVTEAIADVEVFGYKTSTRSIHVLSGAWIAYSHVDYSGNQYILEKGFYNNCADWGSQDNRICSVQPVLLAPGAPSSKSKNEIILYSEPDFQGECRVFDSNQDSVSDKLLAKSCRVVEGSWVLYDSKQYAGNMYVLSEGHYPNLNSMGCPPGCTIRSVKAVPLMLSVPSISLFSLEGLEGKEITTDTEIYSMVEEGFNNHILSVRVNTGCWVVCEHSNYRGRQFLLEPIEITNWPKFSLLDTIGSIYPIRQKRHFFRINNKESGHYMSVQGGVEEMKSGRVVVAPEVEPMSDIWFYQDGLIKNKLSQTMNLQVMGNVEPGAKLVVWTETRQPVQTWTAQTTGLISSLTFHGMVLDVKGGKTYDKDHVVIMPESDERPSQQWEIELL